MTCVGLSVSFMFVLVGICHANDLKLVQFTQDEVAEVYTIIYICGIDFNV